MRSNSRTQALSSRMRGVVAAALVALLSGAHAVPEVLDLSKATFGWNVAPASVGVTAKSESLFAQRRAVDATEAKEEADAAAAGGGAPVPGAVSAATGAETHAASFDSDVHLVVHLPMDGVKRVNSVVLTSGMSALTGSVDSVFEQLEKVDPFSGAASFSVGTGTPFVYPIVSVHSTRNVDVSGLQPCERVYKLVGAWGVGSEREEAWSMCCTPIARLAHASSCQTTPLDPRPAACGTTVHANEVCTGVETSELGRYKIMWTVAIPSGSAAASGQPTSWSYPKTVYVDVTAPSVTPTAAPTCPRCATCAPTPEPTLAPTLSADPVNPASAPTSPPTSGGGGAGSGIVNPASAPTSAPTSPPTSGGDDSCWVSASRLPLHFMRILLTISLAPPNIFLSNRTHPGCERRILRWATDLRRGHGLHRLRELPPDERAYVPNLLSDELSDAISDASHDGRLVPGECFKTTVTFHANPSHNFTCSP